MTARNHGRYYIRDTYSLYEIVDRKTGKLIAEFFVRSLARFCRDCLNTRDDLA